MQRSQLRIGKKIRNVLYVPYFAIYKFQVIKSKLWKTKIYYKSMPLLYLTFDYSRLRKFLSPCTSSYMNFYKRVGAEKGEILRKFSIIFGVTSITLLISASVVYLDRLKRIEPCA